MPSRDDDDVHRATEVAVFDLCCKPWRLVVAAPCVRSALGVISTIVYTHLPFLAPKYIQNLSFQFIFSQELPWLSWAWDHADIWEQFVYREPLSMPTNKYLDTVHPHTSKCYLT